MKTAETQKITEIEMLLSDHGMQSYKVFLVENNKKLDSTELDIVTWNTLNKKASAETLGGGYSNNPENIDESDEDYITRRLKQFEKIKYLLKEKHLISLQEFDCLFTIGKEKPEYLITLEEKFFNILKDNNWGVVIPQHKNPHAIRKTVVLYNKELFEIKAQHNVLPVEKKFKNNLYNQFTGLAVILKNKKDNQKICFVGMHLDYEHNYSTQIKQFLTQNTKNDCMTIMIGDTNRPPNHSEDNTRGITNWRYATAYRYDKENEKFSIEHNDKKYNSPVIDAIDVMFCSPTRKTQIVITETHKECFKIEDGKPKLYNVIPSQELNYHHTHQSLIGLPWQRRQATLMDLEAAFQTERKKLKKTTNAVTLWESKVSIIMKNQQQIKESEKNCDELLKLLRLGTKDSCSELKKICEAALKTVFECTEPEFKLSTNMHSFSTSQQKTMPKKNIIWEDKDENEGIGCTIS